MCKISAWKIERRGRYHAEQNDVACEGHQGAELEVEGDAFVIFFASFHRDRSDLVTGGQSNFDCDRFS